MVPVAGLSNSKSAAPTPILSGHQLTQTLKATNNGPAVGNRDVTAGIQMLETVCPSAPVGSGLARHAGRLSLPKLDDTGRGRGIVGNECRLGRHLVAESAVSGSRTAEQVTTPGQSSPHTFLAQPVGGDTLVQGSAGCLDSARMTNAV